MKNISKFLALTINCFLVIICSAQETITKKIYVGNATKIELSHEYAQVKVKTWDKSYVEAIALVDIHNNNTDIFTISLDKKGKTIYLKTDSDIGKLENPTKNVNISRTTTTDDNGSCDESLKINGVRVGYQMSITIEVYIPKSLEIDMNSTYGNSSIFDVSQKINVTNTYAEIDVIFDKLVDGSSVKSTYSNVDVYIPSSESAMITAKTDFGKIYSDLEDYSVSEINEFGFGQNGQLKLGNANKSLSLESDYQNIYVRTKKKLTRLTN